MTATRVDDRGYDVTDKVARELVGRRQRTLAPRCRPLLIHGFRLELSGLAQASDDPDGDNHDGRLREPAGPSASVRAAEPTMIVYGPSLPQSVPLPCQIRARSRGEPRGLTAIGGLTPGRARFTVGSWSFPPYRRSPPHPPARGVRASSSPHTPDSQPNTANPGTWVNSPRPPPGSSGLTSAPASAVHAICHARTAASDPLGRDSHHRRGPSAAESRQTRPRSTMRSSVRWHEHSSPRIAADTRRDRPLGAHH
jgi:hypothetical protein